MASSTAIVALGDQLGKEVVTLFVGPKRKEFVIHKQLLYKSTDFFKKAFDGKFKEAQKGEMDLPVDSPGAVSIYIDWLYRSTLPLLKNIDQLDDFIDLYIFADKLNLVTLQDRTMDTIQDLLTADHDLVVEFLCIERMGKVFELTDVSLGLSDFLIYVAAEEYYQRALDVRRTGKDCSEEISFLRQACEENLEVVVRFSERLSSIISANLEGDREIMRTRDEDDAADRCFFHRHAKSYNCRPGKNPGK